MDQDKVREIYDRTAEDYEDWVIPCKLCQYNMLLNTLNIEGNERVLDIGCGPGELTRTIAQRLDKGKIIGLDLSEKMIRLARKRSREIGAENIEFINSDFINTDFEKKFDICVSSYLFHWISDHLSFLKKIKNILKKDGRVGIIAPSPEWYKEVQESYEKVMREFGAEAEELIGKKVISHERIEKHLKKAGLEIVNFTEFNFREKTSIENCLKRVDAKSDQSYLRRLPRSLENSAKQRLIEELEKKFEGMITTECGYIIVGKNK